MVDYLYHLFALGKSYAVINSHKSMLTQTLPFFGNTWCESCKLISRFMKGVFINKPHVPRYCFTWDVSVVIKFLESLYPLRSLSLKMLTLKLTALIALANAPRSQTLVALNLDHMVIEKDAIVFLFPSLLKTSRVGHNFSLKLEHFEKEELCTMHTLMHYIKRTRKCRQSRNVLISYVTYKSVSTSTVARWLKFVLNSSGINTDIFKAHSFRGASTSAALNKGCSLNLILKTADWKSDKVFKKYYYRHSVSNKQLTYADAVFS